MQNWGGGEGGGKQSVLWCIKKWIMACTIFVTYLALSISLEKTLLHFEAVMNPSPHIAIPLPFLCPFNVLEDNSFQNFFHQNVCFSLRSSCSLFLFSFDLAVSST